ncbi:heterokaryon incompatibility protein-domain-containing protein [Trichophaea hybrida]|nr:heterokaryon incompatibility protein-domain-containing protein [Trichophaea hybrida]
MADQSNPGPYQYTALSTERDEIRLVILRQGNFSDSVQCDIKTASLSDVPQYTALSYTWGDPTKTAPISLEGHIFKATINLKDALLHLRYPSEDRTFWIDAICINQGDLDERSKQVLRMRDIYHKASSVVVWLGTSDPQTEKAMELIKTLGRIVLDAEELLYQGLKVEYREPFMEEFEENDPLVLQAMNNIFCRTWWSRVWVVQELSLAKQPNAVVLCGRMLVQWTDVLVAAYAIEYCWGLMTKILEGFPEESLSAFQEGLRMTQCRQVRDTDPPFRLIELLAVHRDCNATDPRDHIYGFLGLSGDAVELGIVPDYRKTVEYIFQDFVRCYVTATGSLDVITACQTPRNLTNLPSWVPDWSKERQTSTLCLYERFHGGGYPSRNIERYYAAGDTRAEVRFSDDLDEISVKGFIFGRIAYIGTENTAALAFEDVDTFGLLDENGKSSIANRNNRMMKPPLRDLTNLSEEDEDEDLRIVDDSGTGEYAGTDDDTEMEDDDTEMDDDEEASDILIDVQRSEQQKTRVFSPMRLLSITEVAFRTCIEVCYAKRVAILDNGYIGLVPGHTAVGDVACILFGCSVPIMLRKNGNHYVMVGESYFHDVAEGELILDYEKHFESVEFSLR